MYKAFIAMFVIIFAAFVMNLISTLINKYFVYTPEYIEKKRFVEEIRKEYMRALRSKDEKLIRKMEKKVQSIRKMEFELSAKAFRPLIITLILFWILWWLLGQMYSDLGAFILSPIPLPFLGASLDFFGWYIIASLWFGVILRKLLIAEI